MAHKERRASTNGMQMAMMRDAKIFHLEKLFRGDSWDEVREGEKSGERWSERKRGREEW